MSTDMFPQPAIDYIAEQMERENYERRRKERLLPRSIVGPDTGRSLCDPWIEVPDVPLASGGFIPPAWQEELIKNLWSGRSTVAETRRDLDRLSARRSP